MQHCRAMPASLALVVLCLHCPFSSAAGSADDDSRLSEVFVTAQRRSETLQDVAVAINVITSTEAKRAGIVGTDSLQWAAPGLVLNRQSGSGGAPFLRGVGTNTGVTGAELPVAMYVDDVYLGSPLATIFPFENLDQVEVLKGPQGTLFGRNATGGVILRSRLLSVTATFLRPRLRFTPPAPSVAT
jgi:iron complex outermembrane receptor protein